MKPTIRTQRVERCQVAELMAPPKRLTDVDYKRKNYQNLKKSQEENKKKKEEEETRPQKEPFKLSRFKNVESIVYKNPEEVKKPRKASAPVGGPQVVVYDPEDEGVTRNDGEKDYVKDNYKAAIVQAPIKPVEKQEENAKALNPNYGKVPQYLEDYKAQREADRETKRRQEEDAKCPPGMRLMPEEERLETLEILQKGKDDVWMLINKLPIASNTQSVIRRREEYEKKLQELENAIKTFSRPKVYVAL
ncbi:unnamed protein product [Blepharisma stoltei]|uniref:Enkurin domain-containing protein n=1 Tax=Blepharisma stoltei TaxID=1481888 RepID=A0AAU9K0W7_9CILI|nr:unnamed protein product [Blepharisma stoltei]